ncbi:MAG: transposase [Proteobacteria bacterium]|nr:transposase [Pseudomonadota bacterium]MBU1714685.1 transposase [Pseudomonadota bacterium]
MKKRNIYVHQSQELLGLLEQAGNSTKVMCVPIDYAKKDHLVMFCNGHGDILRKPFPIKNTPEGVNQLAEQVYRSCRYHQINPAHDAKKQRENLQASTDRLDLMGIARMLLNRRWNCCPAQSGAYRNLRTLVRHRRKLVVMTTEVRNRIHTAVDRLFPGFLSESNSGITPFSKSSLWLMENRFSAPQIRRRKRQTLVESLRRNGIPKPDQAAAKLQEYAARVLDTPDEYLDTLQLSLSQHVTHHRCLQENIEQIETEIAVWLAQTQGAFLTSVRGIGIVLAAGVTAEIGDPNMQKPLNNLTSYAGIVPKITQTGGPEGSVYIGKVAKRSNRILKDYIVQSASHMGLHGPEELMADYKRRDAAGQHADFGIARRYLRMGICLMKTSQVYLPDRFRKNDAKPEERAGYYLMNWPSLRDKWRKAGAIKAAFDQTSPLGQWRDMVQKIYDIKLTL